MSTRRSMLNRWSRKLHRWGTVLVVVPLILVIVTGILLMLKGQSSWVQPPTAQGSGQDLEVTWDELLTVVSEVDEAGVQGWEDVDRLDIRPSRGIAKVRAMNRWEIQVDTSTGEVLQVAYRRSDLIE